MLPISTGLAGYPYTVVLEPPPFLHSHIASLQKMLSDGSEEKDVGSESTDTDGDGANGSSESEGEDDGWPAHANPRKVTVDPLMVVLLTHCVAQLRIRVQSVT